jgi:hypothetical protein
MSQACSDGFDDGGATHRTAAASAAVNKLALAASPTFVLMALLTGALSGGSAEMLCSAAERRR